MFRRSVPLTAAAIILSGSLIGCSSTSSTASPSTSSGGSIALLLGIAGNPYYGALTCGAEAEAKRLGYDLTVQAPTAWSAPEQIPLLNGITATKPAGAIVAPTDPQALVQPISELSATGAKVVTIDTTIADTSPLVTEIVIDNENGGVLAAKTMSEILGGSGKVLVIQGPQANNVESARRVGFEKELANYSGIEYLGPQYSEGDVEKAALLVTSSLAAHPDVTGIFATNDTGAIGTLAALDQAGMTGKVKVIAFDAATPEVNALKNGTIEALIAQQPYQMGVLAVKAVDAAISGEGSPKDTFVDTVVIKKGDSASADKYEYKGDCK